MMSFFSSLSERIHQARSLLCVGLDPHLEMLPQPTADAARDFCLRIIEATADQACAFKPNSAFFEVHGPEGWRVLQEVITAVPEGIPVILDAKRGDIASTAQAYARTVFETLGADAVTLNPYMGRDAIEPFLGDPERGVFLLCKTSNPSADDLQAALTADGVPLFVRLAHLAQSWNVRDNLGLVVGATDTAAVAAVREAAPDSWLLAPGVGAQGGDLHAALRAGLRTDGLGMVIPVSRTIARASDPGVEAGRLRNSIEEVRHEVGKTSNAGLFDPELALLADDLLGAGCVRFGEFTLKSGMQSPIYIDLRRLASYPVLLVRVAAAYRKLLGSVEYDRLAALPYAALPIATAVALQTGKAMIYPRKEAKTYGTRAPVEGVFEMGETVVVLDDLATTGGSKFEAIECLESVGCIVRDVVVLIDRQSGAGEALANAGYRMHAVFTLTDLIDHWLERGKISFRQASVVRGFLQSEQRS
jgi:uridine monophosphate synthetase